MQSALPILFVATSTSMLNSPHSQKQSTLRRRTTSVGRFSATSETSCNLSIPSFFITLSGETPITYTSLSSLFNNRLLSNPQNHRLKSYIDSNINYFTEIENFTAATVVKPTIHPVAAGRQEIFHIMNNYLTSPFNFGSTKPLWDCSISSGLTGSSKIISGAKLADALANNRTFESLIYFRAHHVVADGVSLATALCDLSDEAGLIKDDIKAEIRKRRLKKHSNIIIKFCKKLMWFLCGSLKVGLSQLSMMLIQSPFSAVRSGSTTHASASRERTLAFIDSITLSEARMVAKRHNVTLNDLFTFCISRALQKLIRESRTLTMPKKVSEENLEDEKQLIYN